MTPIEREIQRWKELKEKAERMLAILEKQVEFNEEKK